MHIQTSSQLQRSTARLLAHLGPAQLAAVLGVPPEVVLRTAEGRLADEGLEAALWSTITAPSVARQLTALESAAGAVRGSQEPRQ